MASWKPTTPEIEFLYVSTSSLSHFNILQWTESFNVLNNPLSNALEYLLIPNISNNENNIMSLMDVTLESQNVCYGQQHCMTTHVCCNAQISTTAHVITIPNEFSNTQFDTATITDEISNIISAVSNDIMIYLWHISQHRNDRQNTDDWIHAFYTQDYSYVMMDVYGDNEMSPKSQQEQIELMLSNQSQLQLNLKISSSTKDEIIEIEKISNVHNVTSCQISHFGHSKYETNDTIHIDGLQLNNMSDPPLMEDIDNNVFTINLKGRGISENTSMNNRISTTDNSYGVNKGIPLSKYRMAKTGQGEHIINGDHEYCNVI